ncbi:hypothetical protein [Aliirhizobium terrae]|uniref:hypothetical protein n=1 Tax=Terrirhizobium terrae TaxID=2926709 RepID=UPI00336A117A
MLALLEGGHETISVDLETQEIRLANHVFRLEIEPVWRTKLLNGWDDLDLTASYAADIARYGEADRERHPWLQQPGAE